MQLTDNREMAHLSDFTHRRQAETERLLSELVRRILDVQVSSAQQHRLFCAFFALQVVYTCRSSPMQEEASYETRCDPNMCTRSLGMLIMKRG